jgi:hypothetical protein
MSEIPDDHKILKHEFPDVSDLYHSIYGQLVIPIDGNRKLNVTLSHDSKYMIVVVSDYGTQMSFKKIDRMEEVIEYAIARRTEDKFKGG